MKLTCDNCGSVQSENNARCELCGDSLHEEAERKERGTAAGLLIGAVGATLMFCVLPGVLLKVFYFPETATPMFLAGYAAAWVVGSIVGRFFQPKDSYDFGYRMRGHGYIDNPFSLRDDFDRHHAGVGLILFPINVVSGLWLAFFFRLTGN